jgi:hypothetical protein
MIFLCCLVDYFNDFFMLLMLGWSVAFLALDLQTEDPDHEPHTLQSVRTGEDPNPLSLG